MRAKLLLTLILIAAACGDSGTTPEVEVTDERDDCRAVYATGPAECRPGVDILSVSVHGTPLVVEVKLAAPPELSDDVQWSIQFTVGELACGIDNLTPDGDGFTGSTRIVAYGYNIVSGEESPEGICEGSLDGTTATIVFNVQRPEESFGLRGVAEIASISDESDDGAADDVRVPVDGAPSE